MAWVRIDDHMPMHEKTLALSDAAFRLYINAICWANLHRTNGIVPLTCLPYVSRSPRPKRLIGELISAGLWDQTEAGYRIHNYLKYQVSADDIERRARQNAERQARWRARVRNAANNGSDDAPHNPVINATDIDIDMTEKISRARAPVVNQTTEQTLRTAFGGEFADRINVPVSADVAARGAAAARAALKNRKEPG